MTEQSSDVSARNHRTWSGRYAAFSYRKAEGLFAAEAAIFERLADEMRRAHLLDLGIGSGRTTAVLADRVERYVGCDYSPSMVALAMTRHPSRDVRVADARSLPEFAEASFDIVLFSFNGIDGAGHDDRLKILSEVHRVLRPAGIYVMSTHNRAAARVAAYSLSNFSLSWNPVRLVYRVSLYFAGIANRLVRQGGEREEPEYAIVNDAAHQYALLQYYIYPADQVRQLQQVGFRDVAAYDLDGRRLEDVAVPPPDYMIHYVARKGSIPGCEIEPQRI